MSSPPAAAAQVPATLIYVWCWCSIRLILLHQLSIFAKEFCPLPL